VIRPARLLLLTIALAACSTSPSASTSIAATAALSQPPSAVPTTSVAPSTAQPTRLIGVAKRLDAGAYVYDFALPHVTLRVPASWYLSEAMPRHFGLHPDDVLVDESLRVWFDMRVASPDPACPEEPASGVGHSAADLVTAFRANPGVVATAPEPVSIGGLDGQVIDVGLAPSWKAACPFTNGAPSVPLFLDDNVPDEPAFWGITGPERLRLMVLDDRNGSNVVVMIDSTSGTTLDALEATAKPVLDTFRFAVGD
jgi:hypothetical protein